MLRSLFLVTLTVSVLASAPAGADVYKYTDEKGNTQYTDKPATLPAERLNVQTQKTDTVAVQAREDAEQKRMQNAAQGRAQTSQQRSEEQAASQLTAKDKADRCVQARQRYDMYMNSQRLFETMPGGERRYLSDAELDAARNSAKVSMEAMCK